MLGIIEAIKEIASAFKEAFAFGTTKTERQSESTVIKDSKNKQKAIEYAEQIIFLVDRYLFADLTKVPMLGSREFEKKYHKLREKFFKYN